MLRIQLGGPFHTKTLSGRAARERAERAAAALAPEAAGHYQPSGNGLYDSIGNPGDIKSARDFWRPCVEPMGVAAW